MISPEDNPGCQGLHYIFNYKDIHMVTLQYVQLLNMHPKPCCNARRACDLLENPFWDVGLLLGSHTDCGMGMAFRCSPQENSWKLKHKSFFLSHQTFLITSQAMRMSLNQHHRPPMA